MIKVVFLREGGEMRGLVAAGHAGFAPSGSDIVCAAVSGVLLTACAGLEAKGAEVVQRDARGYLRARFAGETPHDAQVILETAALGLRMIEAQYPRRVRVIYRSGRLR